MHLVEILLPTKDNKGRPFSPDLLIGIQEELAGRFGGVTAFTMAPAKGLWKARDDQMQKEEIIVVEVMIKRLHRVWWAAFRRDLEQRLHQKSIVIRATEMERL